VTDFILRCTLTLWQCTYCIISIIFWCLLFSLHVNYEPMLWCYTYAINCGYCTRTRTRMGGTRTRTCTRSYCTRNIAAINYILQCFDANTKNILSVYKVLLPTGFKINSRLGKPSLTWSNSAKIGPLNTNRIAASRQQTTDVDMILIVNYTKDALKTKKKTARYIKTIVADHWVQAVGTYAFLSALPLTQKYTCRIHRHVP